MPPLISHEFFSALSFSSILFTPLFTEIDTPDTVSQVGERSLVANLSVKITRLGKYRNDL